MKRQLLLIFMAMLTTASYALPSRIERPQPLGPNVKYWLTGMETSNTSGKKLRKTLYTYDASGMPLREEEYTWDETTSKYELNISKEYKWAENTFEEIDSYNNGYSEKKYIEENPEIGVSTEYQWTKQADQDWVESSKYVYVLDGTKTYYQISESWYYNQDTGALYLSGATSYENDARGRCTKETKRDFNADGTLRYESLVEKTFMDNDCIYPTSIIQYNSSSIVDGKAVMVPVSKEVSKHEYFSKLVDVFGNGWYTPSNEKYSYDALSEKWRLAEVSSSEWTSEGNDIYTENYTQESYLYDDNNNIASTRKSGRTTKNKFIYLKDMDWMWIQEQGTESYSINGDEETHRTVEYTYSEDFPRNRTRKLCIDTEQRSGKEPSVEGHDETWEYDELGNWTEYYEKYMYPEGAQSGEWTNSSHSLAEYKPGTTAMTRMITYIWSKSENEWKIDYASDSFDGWHSYDWDFNIPSDRVRLFKYNGDVRTEAPYLLKSTLSTRNLLAGSFFFEPTAVQYSYNEDLCAVTGVSAGEGISLWPRAVDDVMHIRIADGSAINAEVFSMNGVRMMTISDGDTDMSTLSAGVYIVSVNGIPFRIIKR